MQWQDGKTHRAGAVSAGVVSAAAAVAAGAAAAAAAVATAAATLRHRRTHRRQQRTQRQPALQMPHLQAQRNRAKFAVPAERGRLPHKEGTRCAAPVQNFKTLYNYAQLGLK
jgi:hypothetical protein